MANVDPKVPVSLPKIDINNDSPVFSWQAPEFSTTKRNVKKLAGSILIAVAIAVIFIWQKQWTSVGVVVMAMIVLITLSSVRPKNVKCAIYRAGVIIDDKVYNFDQLKSFWLVYTDRYKIRLQLVGKFSGQVTMPLTDSEDPEQMRMFLAKYLPEEAEKGQDLNDMINHWLRF